MTEQEQPIPRKAVRAADGLSEHREWLLDQYAEIIERYHPTRDRAEGVERAAEDAA
jgi:hypothetical protein